MKVKKEQFAELIEENKYRFYKTAKAILKNEDDTCDVIQEALLAMYTNIETLKNQKYFVTWGIRIIINKSYDYIRKNSKNNVSLDQEEGKYEVIDYENHDLEKIELEELISKLDEKSRLIVTLYYYDDLKVKEIAQILNKPEGTVKYELSEIRKKLRKLLEVE